MPLPHSPRPCPGSSNYLRFNTRHAILMVLALVGCVPGDPSPQEIKRDCRTRTVAHLRRAEVEAFSNGRQRTSGDYVTEAQRVMSDCMTTATSTAQFCKAAPKEDSNSSWGPAFLAEPSMIAPQMDFECGPATP